MGEKIVVAVTGITGKSGRFFLDRLTAEGECLGSYRFLLLGRTEPKALLEKAAKHLDIGFAEA